MNMVFPWREAPQADFAVIGDPVAHSLSPVMHAAAYDALGLPYRYMAIHVSPGEVPEALDRLKSLGYRGVNVTVPHKEEVLNWATDVEPFALKARAANTLNLVQGSAINTDAPGFLDTIRYRIPDGASILMLGAGGSSRALAIALVDAGYRLKIHNRTAEKAHELALLSGCLAAPDPDPIGADLILNTTSASLQGAELAVLWDQASKSALAYDLAYAPSDTPFMTAAKAAGLQAMDGRELLAAQGARSFEWWTGLPGPRDAMLAALR